MKKRTKNRKKTYDLGRKVRDPQKKDLFTSYVEPIRGSRMHHRYTTVERQGESKLTFYGYYNANLLDFQNERKLEEATCKSYDNTVCTLIAPAFADYALEEMDELDYLTCWQKILDSADSTSKLNEAYSLVRMIADYAYRHGDTSVTLWGLMPEDGRDLLTKVEAYKPQQYTAKEKKCARERETKHYADRGIRIGRSISLVTEFKLFLKMMQQADDFGQVLAGLILFVTGCRTSEAVAFQFKHLTEVYPGCWALQRINISTPEGRNSEVGGKSHNAFRLLWLPGFLAKLILDRREYLLERYTEDEVEMLTISCSGLNYERPCSQKELNNHMKELFRQVGVKEDMVASAFREIQESKENSEEYERSAVAYLGRHQAITAMIYCGLTEAQICVCAGHEQIDTDVEAYDFANPDTFRELVNALSRRPIIQIFDQMAEYQEITYQGGTLPFSSDGWTKIVFPSDREIEFLLCAYSSVGNVALELADMEGIQIVKEDALLFPKQKRGKELSIRNDLRIAGVAAYQRAMADFEKATWEGDCVADHLEWVDQIANTEVQIYEEIPTAIAPMPDVQSLLPKVPSVKKQVDIEPDPSVAGAATPCFVEETSLAPEDSRTTKNEPRKSATEVRHVDSNAQLLVLNGSGELIDLDIRQLRLFRRGTRGQKEIRNQDATMLYLYQPDAPACLISRSGKIYYIPAGKLWDESNARYRNVLQSRGILLQDPALTQAGASLVCMTSNGDVVRLSVNSLSGSFPRDGRALIAEEFLKESQTEVVSACVCPAQSDVLLVTKNGQALRLADASLRMSKSFHLKPIKGISLEEGDRAVACIPYTPAGVLSITAEGFGLLFRGKAEITFHGRASRGVAFVKLREGDQIVSAMIPNHVVGMLRKDGFLCCTEVSGFPEQGRGCMGVKAMSPAKDKPIMAAIPISLVGQSK